MQSLVENARLKTLKSAPLDSWIAVTRDETIIASAETYGEVWNRLSELNAPNDITIVKTPKVWVSPSA